MKRPSRPLVFALLTALSPLALDGCVSVGVKRSHLPEPPADGSERRERSREEDDRSRGSPDLRKVRRRRGVPPRPVPRPLRDLPCGRVEPDARRALDVADVGDPGPRRRQLPDPRDEADHRERRHRSAEGPARERVRPQGGREGDAPGRPEEDPDRLDHPRRRRGGGPDLLRSQGAVVGAWPPVSARPPGRRRRGRDVGGLPGAEGPRPVDRRRLPGERFDCRRAARHGELPRRRAARPGRLRRRRRPRARDALGIDPRRRLLPRGGPARPLHPGAGLHPRRVRHGHARPRKGEGTRRPLRRGEGLDDVPRGAKAESKRSRNETSRSFPRQGRPVEVSESRRGRRGRHHPARQAGRRPHRLQDRGGVDRLPPRIGSRVPQAHRGRPEGPRRRREGITKCPTAGSAQPRAISRTPATRRSTSSAVV